MAHDTIDALKRVLSQERVALISGTYEGLAEMADSKRQLLEKLEKQKPSGEQLLVLKTQMATNQDLIAAALQGVAAAKDRIKALEQVRDGLRTYSPNGTVAVVAQQTAMLEKKA